MVFCAYHVLPWCKLGQPAMLLLPAHDGEQLSVCIVEWIFALFVDVLIPRKRASRESQKGPKVGN